MKRRKLVYLILIAPLHYLAMILAALPAFFLLPPDLLQQMFLAVPLFCVLLMWSVPALLRMLGFSRLSITIFHFGHKALALALVGLAVVVAAAAYGIITTAQAQIFFAALIILGHAALLRKLS